LPRTDIVIGHIYMYVLARAAASFKRPLLSVDVYVCLSVCLSVFRKLRC